MKYLLRYAGAVALVFLLLGGALTANADILVLSNGDRIQLGKKSAITVLFVNHLTKQKGVKKIGQLRR